MLSHCFVACGGSESNMAVSSSSASAIFSHARTFLLSFHVEPALSRESTDPENFGGWVQV